MKNLNNTLIPCCEGPDESLVDFGITKRNISVYFKDLEHHLIQHIHSADAIFGCVAWMTNHNILDALSSKSTSIIVQKEDFLKPDIDISKSWKNILKDKYNGLYCSLNRFNFPETVGGMSWAGDNSVSGVRCVGNCNKDRNPSFPRMHNKFIVFAQIDYSDSDDIAINPLSVWTGSFNFSTNATYSFENAIYIEDTDIASAYFKEYCQILALSEPLNWKTEWLCPEWRIGS